MTLNINFYKKGIDETLKIQFNLAVEHEKTEMLLALTNEEILKIKKKIANENGTYSKEKVEAFKAQLTNTEEKLEQLKIKSASTLEIYNTVVTAMTVKQNGFCNHKDVVRTVLRVLAAGSNSKLMKQAIIPAFESPALYEALETIHATSKAGENGELVMSKEVKEAYKAASTELESIIKNTFSLPFETIYTEKTRVKMNADDKKLLNSCYIKGFSNKFEEDEGVVSFKKRQVSTLVKVRKDKSGEKKCDYSGLAEVICNIVTKHYYVV